MLSRSRAFVAPIYLFACLILGGSAQGIWQNMLLQLAGIGVIAWAAIERESGPITRSGRQLLLFAAVAIVIIALQLIPLPAALWPHLGPRKEIADGFQVLGQRIPAEPLSLAPASTLSSLLGLIPPIAIVCAMVRLKAFRPQWLAIALIAGTLAGIMLGALQVAASNVEQSRWYLYPETSNGRAVGFFANADHMATLLVITIPFLAAAIAWARTSSPRHYSIVFAAVAGVALVVIVGLAFNGSLAGYALGLPVIVASVLVLLPPGSRWGIWMVTLAVTLVIGATAGLERTAIGSGQIGEHAASSVQSRLELFDTTSRAAAEFMPLGSGLGSFRRVYPLYEKPEQVTTTYAVHAHNDYVELALELGFAGMVMVLLFLGWWAVAVWRAWRTAEAGPFARAAAIASGAVLIHSLVDFPLRTAAIAACFGMCLALLAEESSERPNKGSA